MSVVNQMLRDLERQDPKADLFETASAADQHQSRPYMVWMVILLMFALIGGIVYFWLVDDRLTTAPKHVSVQSQLGLAESQGEVTLKSENPLNAASVTKVPSQSNLNESSKIVLDNTGSTELAEPDRAPQETTISKPDNKASARELSASAQSKDSEVVSDQKEAVEKQPQIEKPVVNLKPEIVAKETSQTQSNIRQLSEKQIKKEKLQVATNMIAQGLWGAAEKQLIEITKDYPDYHAAIEKLAYVYIQTSNDSALKALLESSILAHPGHLNYRILLARQYAEVKQWNMVISVASPITQPHKTLSVMQAIAHQQLDQHQRAVAIYVELLKRFPERGEWWIGLSISLEALKRPKDAHQALVKASNDPRLTQQQSQYIGQKLKQLEGQF